GYYFGSRVGPLMAFREERVFPKKPKEKFDGAYIAVWDEAEEAAYRFRVPTDFHKSKTVAFAVPHYFDRNGNPSFEIVQDGKDWMVYVPDENSIRLLKNFPRGGGIPWYSTDGEFGIPADFGNTELALLGARSYTLDVPGLHLELPSSSLLLKKCPPFIGLPKRGHAFEVWGGIETGREDTFDVTSRPSEKVGLVAVEPKELVKAEFLSIWEKTEETFKRIINLSRKNQRDVVVDVYAGYSDVYEAAKALFNSLKDEPEKITESDLNRMGMFSDKLDAIRWVEQARKDRPPKILELDSDLAALLGMENPSEVKEFSNKLILEALRVR
ncbi:MAG: hypothetical protein V1909_06570, partial [Candidatus Micrarchaeota archaeon]